MSVTIPRGTPPAAPVVACTPPRRSHRWDRVMRERKRKAQAVKDRLQRAADWNHHRVLSQMIFKIAEVTCRARTSSGKVATQYPLLRKLLKEYTDAGGEFNDSFKLTIELHTRSNARELLPVYRAHVSLDDLYTKPRSVRQSKRR